LPYTVGELGPPLPPCEEQRLKTLQALNIPMDVEAPPDPEVDNILKLVTSIFQCPAALCALFDDKRIFIRNSTGGFARGDFPWRWSFCGWTMASQQDQIMVIPDATKDARFCQNDMVTGDTGVRFYCGAPLIASNGHRLGTLCFADTKPREFDAGQATILGNLAEMVVRHIEKDIALQLKTADNAQLAEAYSQLKRAVDCFDHCVALLDLTQPGWKIMYINGAWNKLTSTDREAAAGHSLSEVFEVLATPSTRTSATSLNNSCAIGTPGALPSSAHLAAAAAGKEIVIENVVIRASHLATAGNLAVGANSAATATTGATNSGNTTRKLMLRLRPAGRTGIDDEALGVAVPAYIKNDESGCSTQYYFMTVESQDAARSKRSATGMLHAGSEAGWDEEVDPGLKLGVMLGKGAFGSVYRGIWYGTPVAVKIIDQDLRSLGAAGQSMEALLGAELRHPHIVATLRHIVRKPKLQPSHDTLFSDDTAMGSEGSAGHTPPRVMSATTPGVSVCNLTAVAEEAAVEVDGGAVAGTVAGTSAATNKQGSTGANAVGGVSPALLATANMSEASEASSARWAVINFDSKAPCQLEEEEGGGLFSCTKPASSKLPSGNMAWGSTSASGQGGLFNMSPAPYNQDTQRHTGPMFAQTWLILEYCDRGCLQDAVDRGWLRTPERAPNMTAVLATAYEMASALNYLHSHGIIHGDLSAWNVLLTSQSPTVERGTRGFAAKIADFGMARALDIRTRIQTKTYGTITHQPPETLADGVVSRETDTYSLGVLMWQMYTGSRPWGGLTHSQIIMTVAQKMAHLQFPPGTPPRYERLARACLSYEAAARPAMADVCRALDDMIDTLGA